MESSQPLSLSEIAHSLPEDIILYGILLKLPVKSLLRFRCVCKNWNSIISSKTFILNYNGPQRFLFIHNCPNWLYTTFQKTPFSAIVQEKMPTIFEPFNKSFSWVEVSSFNGLFCFAYIQQFSCRLYLWNPTIRKHKLLSMNKLFSCEIFYPLAFSVGFDSVTKDYKILKITFVKNGSHSLIQAEIYSLNMDSWRRLPLPDFLRKGFFLKRFSNYAYLDGVLHWFAILADENNVFCTTIFSFNFSDEKFREVKSPESSLNYIAHSIQQGLFFQVRLIVFRGLLSLVVDEKNGTNNGGNSSHIWMKNGNFWTEKKVTFSEKVWHSGCVGDRFVIYKGFKTYLFDPFTLEEEEAKEISSLSFVYAFRESLALM